MPTLIVENVPTELYVRLEKMAAAEQRPLPDETLHLLKQIVMQKIPVSRLPEYVPSEEISAPCDLPFSSIPLKVTARTGPSRLPDPVTDADIAE